MELGVVNDASRRSRMGTCQAVDRPEAPGSGVFWPLGRVPAKGGGRLRELNRVGGRVNDGRGDRARWRHRVRAGDDRGPAPAGADESAPAAFIRAVARAAQRRRGSEVICCLPVALTADIAREVAMPDVKYVSPSRAAFLELLDSADVYFVNPGLYGPFEAFEAGRWVALTPPISYTQVGQALEFHKRGVAGDVPLLGEVIASVGPQEFTFGGEQENCFRRIAEWWEQISAKPSTHEELEQWAAITMVEGNATLRNARREMAEATRRLPHAANVLTNIIPEVSR